MFRSTRLGLSSLTKFKIFGTTAAVYSLQSTYFAKPLRNDFAVPTLSTSSNNSLQQQAQQELKPKYDGAFGGKLNYQELSIGSFVGLFTGIIIGKLSHVLWAVTLSSYLLIQWLNSRNVINFKFNKVVKIGTNYVDLRNLVFERPSFNISFVLAFVISAWNV